jgi:hypothetical protein
MPPSIPRPATLIGAAGKGVDAIEQAITLVPRLVAIVTEVEALLTRVQDVVTAIELTQQRAQAVVERTEVVVAEAAAMTEIAGPLVEQLAPLLQDSLPTLQQLEPMLRRVTETTDPDEVAAVVTMVDLMPELVGKVKDDIFPVLDTLGTVAPDLRDLLDVSKELNEMLAAVPGFGWAKRKLDEQEDQEAAYRADEEPPSAPDRGA